MSVLDRETIQSALLRSAADLLEESGDPAIVLNLASLSLLSESELLQVERWSRQQPCPVIGVGSESAEAASCADVIVESGVELNTMLRRIASNPQAASVLVQVLRAIEHLSPEDGLVVESLGYSTLQSGEEFKRWLTQHQAQNPGEPPKESGPPVLSNRNGDQLTLILNRPENSNAYTVEMRDALTEAFKLVELDTSIRQVSVTSTGRCFCTGGELTEFGKVGSPAAGHMIRSQISPAKLLLSAAERYHFHVHKACIGSGIELPACAGHLTASPKTVFWLPELSMGLIPGAGGCVSISRRIGRRRTAYLVLMNKKIDAQTALEWGLIDGIVSEQAD